MSTRYPFIMMASPPYRVVRHFALRGTKNYKKYFSGIDFF